MPSASLLSLWVCLCLAADPAPSEDARPNLSADLVANRDSYLKLVKEFDEDLATMRAVRQDFHDSADKDALIRRWNSAHMRCQDRMVVENRIRND